MRTLTIVAAMLVFAISLAAFPEQMNYQGKLTDPDGVAIEGPVTIRFSFWDSETGGIELWFESSTVDVYHGLFDKVLGETTPIDIRFESPVWIELEVGGEALTPRQKLTSVPMSFRAAVAESLAGGIIGDHNDLSGLQGGTPGEYYHLTFAELRQIGLNQMNIGDLTYTEDNYVVDGEPLTESIDKLDMEIADISGGTSDAYVQNQDAAAQTGDFWIDGDGRLDGDLTVGNIVGQGSAFNAMAAMVTITSPTVPVTLASVTYIAGGPGSFIHLQFAGNFDDRGGQEGAFVEVELVRDPGGAGEILISTARISVFSQSVYQLQTFSISGVDSPPAGSHTYIVRARAVKDPYTSGRCLSGVLKLAEIKE